MNADTVACPFCGAPYRETIPSEVIHLRCMYCGGTILVPASAPRCPNHSGVLSVSLCNECGKSYCDESLNVIETKAGTLYICSSCFKKKQASEATLGLVGGVLIILLSLFLLIASPTQGVVYAFIVLPLGAFAIYRYFNVPSSGVTLKERREAKQKELMIQKSWASRASDFEIQQRLLTETMREHGAETGWQVLERRLDSYVKAGMTRSQALRKLAEEKGY